MWMALIGGGRSLGLRAGKTLRQELMFLRRVSRYIFLVKEVCDILSSVSIRFLQLSG